MAELTPEELRNLLDYNPETGVLTWKPRDGATPFNRRFAGKEASHIDPTRHTAYKTVRIMRKLYYAHRVCWAIYHGEWPKEQIDHIDSDGTNNAISNLRSVSQRANGMNLRRKRNNTSGATGVWWHKQINRWAAEIMVNRKKVYLGTFLSKEDAVAARLQAERKYGFHPLHGKKLIQTCAQGNQGSTA